MELDDEYQDIRLVVSGSGTRRPWKVVGPRRKKEFFLKHFTNAIGSERFSTTPVFTDLCYGITNGESDGKRIGNKIVIRQVMIRGHCTASTSTVLQTCRLVLIYDKQPNGALPAFTDIYNNAECNTLPRVDISERFTFLKEWYFPISGYQTGTLTAAGVSSTYLIDETIDCYCPIMYGASTGAASDLKEGNLFLVQIGEYASSATNPIAVLNLQVNYTDN